MWLHLPWGINIFCKITLVDSPAYLLLPEYEYWWCATMASDLVVIGVRVAADLSATATMHLLEEGWKQ